MTLDELAIKYGSDKSSAGGHNYMPFYETHLPKNPKKLLEIGVKAGASIRMWKEWFPETIIHGLDLFQEFPIPDIQDVVWHKGNQCDWQLLEQLRKENFDIIVDDGSHDSRHQLMTFFGLFNGGQYYIEDLHCCFHSLYRDGLPEDACAYDLFNSLHDSPSKLKIIREKNIVLIESI